MDSLGKSHSWKKQGGSLGCETGTVGALVEQNHDVWDAGRQFIAPLEVRECCSSSSRPGNMKISHFEKLNIEN